MKYVVEVTSTTVSRHEVEVVLPLGATGPEAETIGDVLMRRAARSGQQIITADDRALGTPETKTKVTRVKRGDLTVYPRRESEKKAPASKPASADTAPVNEKGPKTA